MGYLKAIWESPFLNHELAFKFSAVLGILFFVFVLFKTNIRRKQRPILIVCLYAGYLSLQIILPTEMFPFTSFPERSYPESKNARYVKVTKRMEGGDIEPLYSHPLLLKFSGGRPKHVRERFFEHPSECDRFAETYIAQKAEGENRKIRELRFESRKWDWVHDPHDTDYGFFVKRMVCKA